MAIKVSRKGAAMSALAQNKAITRTTGFQRRLKRLMAEYRHGQNPDLAIDLFRALGWGEGEYQLEPTSNAKDNGLFRLDIAGETSAFLMVHPTGPSEEAVHRATNVAYNSGVDWAAVTNFGTTRLLNARWGNKPTHLSLGWEEYPIRRDDLELLSPKAIVDGQLAASAIRAEQKDQELLPVDRDLMRRLQNWRRLIMQSSPSAVDSEFHELIGRLFFVRSCEDRKILDSKSLLKLLSQNDTTSLSQALNSYFTRLSIEFGAELFGIQGEPLPDFDDVILARIIRDLYTPFPGLPHYQYDFAFLNVDVLGKAYERYVSTVLVRQEVPPPAQMSFIDSGPHSQVEVVSRSKRREGGIFYTPPFLVNYIVQHTVEPLLKQAQAIDQFPRVADLSCGSGAFLTRAANRLAARAKELAPPGVEENWHRGVIPRLVGFDDDERAVTLARVNLWTLATMGEPPRPLPELSDAIITANALFDEAVDARRNTLDVIVGNPPFRSAGELDPALQQRLSQRYGTASDRFDLAYIFMERALQLVRPGGVVGFVLPNRLFVNAAARHLRQHLVQVAVLERVVDFGHQAAFSEGQSYVTLLIVRKRKAGAAANDPPVFVHRVKSLADHPGLQLRRADLLAEQGIDDEFSEVFIAPQPPGDSVWIWTTAGEAAALEQKLIAGALPLREVANVRQGIRTGANDVFLLRHVSSNPHTGLWTVVNEAGEQVSLEPDLLRPCLQGRASIRPYAIADSTGAVHGRYLLYPYRDGEPIEWYQLETAYPFTARYLAHHRDYLTGRKSINRGQPWYGLSWPREENWLGQPKVLTLELIAELAFAADRQGSHVPVGGIAILPKYPEQVPLMLLLGVLNSSVFAWYLSRTGATFRGGYKKLVPGALEAFPLQWDAILAEPVWTERIAALAEAISDRVGARLPAHELHAEIDEIICRLLGLTDRERRILHSNPLWTPVAGSQLEAPLLQLDTSLPAVQQRVDLWLESATRTSAPRQRDLALLQARDSLAAVLDQDGPVKPAVDTLLTFAMIGIDQIRQLPYSVERISLIREVLRAALGTPSDDLVTALVKRLRQAGIEPLLTLARASDIMIGSDEPEDEQLGRALAAGERR